jgi:hypothetical protein
VYHYGCAFTAAVTYAATFQTIKELYDLNSALPVKTICTNIQKVSSNRIN